MARSGRHIFWLVASGLVLATVGFAAGNNWPRFRGPNGAGSANDTDIPVKWNEKHGLLWKVTLPGVGNSSPIVWGNRLFTQSASDDGSRRMLLCVDVRNGKLLWSRDVPGSKAKKHPKNTWASSTPATDGERVYASFWDGSSVSILAYDFQGKKVWQKDLGNFVSQHRPPGLAAAARALSGLLLQPLRDRARRQSARAGGRQHGGHHQL